MDELDRLYERVLVLRCQAGDGAAFEELVVRYAPRLRAFLSRMLDDAAEDALQEVWLDVFRGVGKLRDLGAFATWLYRVARDRAYRALRRRGFKTLPLVEVEAPEDVEIDGDLLSASLDQLPPEQREVVLLRFIERMPYERIAEAVGVGIGTVRSRLHYAKRALRRGMERSQDHE
ncbi:MAG TPA: sigma-70 family RNA polymerase sigma factor [Planctomycetota bacterium]